VLVWDMSVTSPTPSPLENSSSASSRQSENVQRITISLPDELFRQFEEMLEERGFANRSQAIAEILNQHISDYYSFKGNRVMAGTLTLLYEHRKPGLMQQLADIQHQHVNEVISSFRVLLENHHTMDVILMQGPASVLRSITNRFLACKGVQAGRLNLTRTVMPPIHAKHGGGEASSNEARPD
jgi:CopG family nickel-responsive transcriptional regulator